MESLLGVKNKEFQLLYLLRRRENYESTSRILPEQLRVTNAFISRLGLEKELDGHKGCVNCLEWSQSGEILASASDDMRVILWDPFRYKKKIAIQTGHNGNIFSVKFMPHTGGNIVVTGAGDSTIRIHELNLSQTIFVCNCHTNRVKRIATETNPFIFWSAAEDGLILQYDVRVRHECKSENCKNVLVDLVSHAGRRAEAKCVAVNATKPEMIAVGANDPYVRMYDRRMIKLGQVPAIPMVSMLNDWPRLNTNTAGKGDPDDNIPLGCAQYFIAGSFVRSKRSIRCSRHLQSSHLRDNTRNFATTYLTFSADGNELLANMGGEQIYLFDVVKKENIRVLQNSENYNNSLSSEYSDMQDCNDDIRQSAYGITCYWVTNITSMNVKELPQNIEKLKQEADLKFQQQDYTHATCIYNKIINLCPYAAVLYANRAATLMKRRWDGDIYSALRDCQITLRLDCNNVKAHFRLARCLHDLHRTTEAYQVIDDFREKFPNYSSNSSFRALRKDIMEAMNADPEHTSSYPMTVSAHESEWRQNTIDYKLRFCGHCNTTTDIKEANFFGNEYIVAGSDDGSFFIWDRFTTNIVRVLRGDDRIVNCLQPHPFTCLLATSGIDPVIRLWSPLPEDGNANDREVENLHEAASANQIRMNRDPFNMMLINMGYRVPGESLIDDPYDSAEPTIIHPASCRTS